MNTVVPFEGGCFFVFMATLISSTDIQNLLFIGVSFIIGIVAKAHIPWGKNNSEVLDVMTKDFQTLKVLYDAKCEDLKKRDEQLATITADFLQAKTRIQSYENFLQSRTFETDKILKQVPSVLIGIAEHFNIPIEPGGMNGHESAHSQVK